MKNRKVSNAKLGEKSKKSEATKSVSVPTNAIPELSAAECTTFESISSSDQFTIEKAIESFKGLKRSK